MDGSVSRVQGMIAAFGRKIIIDITIFIVGR